MKRFLLLCIVLFVIASSCSLAVFVTNVSNYNYVSLNMQVGGMYSTQHNDTTYLLSLEEFVKGFGSANGYGSISFFNNQNPKKSTFRFKMGSIPRGRDTYFDIKSNDTDSLLAVLNWRSYGLGDSLVVINPYTKGSLKDVKTELDNDRKVINDKKETIKNLVLVTEIREMERKIKYLENRFAYKEKEYKENLEKYSGDNMYRNFPERLVFLKVPDVNRSSKKGGFKVAVIDK